MPIGWFALALPREGSDFVVKISRRFRFRREDLNKITPGGVPIGWFALALPREGSDFVVKISIKSPRGNANRVVCFSFA